MHPHTPAALPALTPLRGASAWTSGPREKSFLPVNPPPRGRCTPPSSLSNSSGSPLRAQLGRRARGQGGSEGRTGPETQGASGLCSGNQDRPSRKSRRKAGCRPRTLRGKTRNTREGLCLGLSGWERMQTVRGADHGSVPKGEVGLHCPGRLSRARVDPQGTDTPL